MTKEFSINIHDIHYDIVNIKAIFQKLKSIGFKTLEPDYNNIHHKLKYITLVVGKYQMFPFSTTSNCINYKEFLEV
jgi:hypothetical protein